MESSSLVLVSQIQGWRETGPRFTGSSLNKDVEESDFADNSDDFKPVAP